MIKLGGRRIMLEEMNLGLKRKLVVTPGAACVRVWLACCDGLAAHTHCGRDVKSNV